MRKHDTTGERLGEQLPTSAIGHMVVIIIRSRRHSYFISYLSVDRDMSIAMIHPYVHRHRGKMSRHLGSSIASSSYNNCPPEEPPGVTISARDMSSKLEAKKQLSRDKLNAALSRTCSALHSNSPATYRIPF